MIEMECGYKTSSKTVCGASIQAGQTHVHRSTPPLKLKLTSAQEKQLLKWWDGTRWVYNQFVEYCRAVDRFKSNNCRLNWSKGYWACPHCGGYNKEDLSQSIKVMRDEGYVFPSGGEFFTLKDSVYAKLLHGALYSFDNAMKTYIGLRKKGYKASKPKFRGKRNQVELNYQVQEQSKQAPWRSVAKPGKFNGAVKILGLGWVSCVIHKTFPDDARVERAHIRRDSVGDWWVTFEYCTHENALPSPETVPDNRVVGLDRGVNASAALPSGKKSSPFRLADSEMRRKLILQQSMARKRIQNPCPSDVWVRGKNGKSRLVSKKCECDQTCWKHSNRYKKDKVKLARLSRREGWQRMDWSHKFSRELASNYDVVVLEKLDIKEMTARGKLQGVKEKRRLNRMILAAGWGQLSTKLSYKTNIVEVPPEYTSQLCPSCGTVAAANRNGRIFACIACGHRGDSDTIAASNIRERYLAQRGSVPENNRRVDGDGAGSEPDSGSAPRSSAIERSSDPVDPGECSQPRDQGERPSDKTATPNSDLADGSARSGQRKGRSGTVLSTSRRERSRDG